LKRPISIFPEGATTNGTSIIQFKRGAFASLLPVQPMCYKYQTVRCNLNGGDAISMWWYLIHVPQTIACIQTFYELPVFEPNDYFWNHHWDGKEEKWLTYANVIRQIIAD
jgi:hypothetical protein